MMLADKFLQDQPNMNKNFAKAGGLSLKELNLLEREFLKAMSYKLVVSEETLIAYKSQLGLGNLYAVPQTFARSIEAPET
jgi:hypothetical protein